MEPIYKDKLNRTFELAEENNKMLKKIVRSMRWSRIFRIISALVVIGASIGIFYFLQPFFEQLGETYSTFRDSVNSLGNVFR